MAFTTGDTVVHPQHGVAKVERIATKGAGKSRTSFLELAFAAKSMTILVPMDSVDDVGIRKLPTKQEVDTILATLGHPSEVPEAWAERRAVTSSRVQSTELLQSSMVIRDLTRHSRRTGRPLGSAESTVLQSCLNSVSAELSLVLEISQDDARDLILERAGQVG